MNGVITAPILLYNDECAVCRSMARWVQKSARSKTGESTIVVRAIGEDPEALRLLSPQLNIWDAYATSHLLMADGSIKLGGEAVAEVFRRSPGTAWIARSLSIRLFRYYPFQIGLNVAYQILADVRPIFGCESCGTPSIWVRPFAWVVKKVKALAGNTRPSHPSPHFTQRGTTAPLLSPVLAKPRS
jgi:predicted DCC family thiol-disulfide oxidoreductase YuxK